MIQLRQWLRVGGSRHQWLLAVGVLCLCSAVLGFAVWMVLDQQRSERLKLKLRAEAGWQVKLLERDLQLSVLAVRELERAWGHSYSLSNSQFQAQADRILAKSPSLHALGFIDESLVLRSVSPQGTMPLDERPAALTSSEGIRTVLHARKTREPAMTDVFQLPDGSGDGFLVLVPIYELGIFRGAIVVSINAANWTELISFRDQSILFVTPDSARNTVVQEQATGWFGRNPVFLAVTETLDLFGNQMPLIVWPRSDFLGDYKGWLPELVSIILSISLSSAVVTLMLLHRTQQAEIRALDAIATLRNSHARIKREVNERRLAEHQARAAKDATAQFLTNMSHEIRTPLNAVMGMFQLIAKGPVPERQRRQAEGGLMASERLLRQLNNVLDIAQLDAGAMTIRNRPARMATLIEEWRSVFEGLLQSSGKPINMSFQMDPDLPEIVVLDRVRLGQIVINLLDNAVKFTSEGCVAMSVSWENGLIIRVQDSGPGIDPDRRDKVFQRFFQVDTGMDRHHEGSGLGLAISKDLAELMQGQLSVEDSEFGGATFVLTLCHVALASQPVDELPRVAFSEGVRS